MNSFLIFDQFVFGLGTTSALAAGLRTTALAVSAAAEESACPRAGQYRTRTIARMRAGRAMPLI